MMKYQKKSNCFFSRPLLLLLALVVTISLLIWTSPKHQHASLKIWIPGVKFSANGEDTDTRTVTTDQFLSGLLVPDFDEESCLSRFQSKFYRKTSPHMPSSYLTSKLRTYEELHKRCGPNTPLFQKSLQQLNLNHSTDESECNYVLWSPLNGIGNRMLTLVSTFLYALLTNRVLLIHQAADMSDLFCEPFPGSTWYIPLDFPIKDFEGFNIYSKNSYGYMIAHNMICDDPNSPSSTLPPFLYVHLRYDYHNHDLHTRFFCECDQEVINKINWVLLKSDNYIVPGLFMIPKYEEELQRMFPIKETVFHHLARYLLHPSNSVWGMVMRYHKSYLAKSKERIGIQARIFKFAPISIDDMYEQIVACTQQELILPEINHKEAEGSSVALDGVTTRAVLVVSLFGDLYEKLKNLYYTHSTTTGEIISVYQPSHEEKEKNNQQLHNKKALAEIWLLSFSDVLVTSSGSTFGYVSYSMAGIKPWFLLSSKNQSVPDPPCRRAVTIDPCFHSPPNLNCRTRSKADTGKQVRHVRHCEDYENGVKLFD